MSDKTSSSNTGATSSSPDVETGTATVVPVYGVSITPAQAAQLSSSAAAARAARQGNSDARPPTPPRGSKSDGK
ncbi:hypothetical protein MY1884_009167 [Beauveria asiatica]